MLVILRIILIIITVAFLFYPFGKMKKLPKEQRFLFLGNVLAFIVLTTPGTFSEKKLTDFEYSIGQVGLILCVPTFIFVFVNKYKLASITLSGLFGVFLLISFYIL